METQLREEAELAKVCSLERCSSPSHLLIELPHTESSLFGEDSVGLDDRFCWPFPRGWGDCYGPIALSPIYS